MKDFIKATEIPTSNRLWKYSNPKTSQKMAYKYLGKNAVLYKSFKRDKKYMVETPDGKLVHFGQLGYEDYTKHKNKTRRKNYRTRSAKIRGNWKQNKYSANNLARQILW